jgi:hypothetical protein
VPGVRHVAADRLIAESLEKAFGILKPTHVYTTTWSRRHRGEGHRGQWGMVRDLLAALFSVCRPRGGGDLADHQRGRQARKAQPA